LPERFGDPIKIHTRFSRWAKSGVAARHWVRPARSPKLLEFSNPNQKQRLSMKAFRSALDATLSGMSAPNLYAALIAR